VWVGEWGVESMAGSEVGGVPGGLVMVVGKRPGQEITLRWSYMAIALLCRNLV